MFGPLRRRETVCQTNLVGVQTVRRFVHTQRCSDVTQLRMAGAVKGIICTRDIHKPAIVVGRPAIQRNILISVVVCEIIPVCVGYQAPLTSVRHQLP